MRAVTRRRRQTRSVRRASICQPIDSRQASTTERLQTRRTELLGVGSSMSESLSNLGSDLSFTISFSISRELLDAAADAGISQEELVAIVLGVGVVFTALPKTLGVLWKELWPPSPADKDEEESRGSLVEFIGILASLVKRISASVSVQLLAATVVSKQPLRSVRITLLLGVVAYFLFLSESSSFGKRRAERR